MTAFPEYVAGDGRYETELMRVTGKRILAKSGAEGTFVLSVPEKGWGIAVKIEDGASRALFPAVTEILAQTGLLDEKGAAQLEQWRIPQLRNWNGTSVGQIRPDLQLFRPSD